MRTLNLIYVLLFSLVCSPTYAAIVILDFEGISSQNTAPLPNDYQGFDWSGGDWELINDNLFTGPFGNSYDSPNGSSSVDSSSGLSSVTFTHTDDFNFLSFDASSFAINDTFSPTFSSTSLTVEGYNNGTLVDSLLFNLSATSFTNFAVNLSGVDEIRFLSDSSGLFWVADNFEVDVLSASPVPVPATVWLLGSGLIGLVGLRKKVLKS